MYTECITRIKIVRVVFKDVIFNFYLYFQIKVDSLAKKNILALTLGRNKLECLAIKSFLGQSNICKNANLGHLLSPTELK